jgi:hypothetical protein
MRTTPDRKPKRENTGGVSSGVNQDNLPVIPTSSEPHRTVKEIAESWNLSQDAVRRIFERESGVFVLDNSASPGKRRYRTLRIPKSVEERVHRHFLNAQSVHK